MTIRKIIIYQRYSTKPIILTDSSDSSREEIINKITEILKSDKISILETSNDLVIIRPSEIQSILISNQQNENIQIEHTNKYSKDLKIENQ